MADRNQDNFFDVLIDRLITDVKRDFEASLGSREVEGDPPAARDSIFDEPPKARVLQYDDLVSKMIGFRTRLDSASAARPQTIYQLEAPRKHEARFEAGDIANGLPQVSRKKADPKFSSSVAQIAFTLVSKSGARFFVEDLSADGEILPEALKRERRRVLLTLHPDRVPENDREVAHRSFLEAAEAFTVLAEGVSSTKAA